jgi:hypothetical protein
MDPTVLRLGQVERQYRTESTTSTTTVIITTFKEVYIRVAVIIPMNVDLNLRRYSWSPSNDVGKPRYGEAGTPYQN